MRSPLEQHKIIDKWLDEKHDITLLCEPQTYLYIEVVGPLDSPEDIFYCKNQHQQIQWISGNSFREALIRLIEDKYIEVLYNGVEYWITKAEFDRIIEANLVSEFSSSIATARRAWEGIRKARYESHRLQNRL